MKCNPLRWLWGVLPIAAVALLASQLEHASIEADLGARIGERLRAAGVSWPKATLSGRDAVIEGRASDDGEPQRAVELASSVWGVRTVANRAELIERADSYAWWAARSAKRIALRGMVPNEATRQTIVGLARGQFPGIDVVDEMRLARGVPNSDIWLAGIKFGLGQLNGLKTGEVRLDGLGMAVSGEAATQTTYRGVKAALANAVPRGISLKDDRVTAPVISPYTWAARFSGSDLTLTGYVPNDRTRSEIVATARSSFARSRVVDRMEVGDGAPAGFVAAATAGVKELARLDEGSASLRDNQLSADGMAVDEATAQTAKRNLRAAVPQGIRVNDQIRFREPQVAAVSPYTGGIEIDGNRLVLSGYVVSTAMQSAVVQAARTRFPGKQIDDRLAVAPGAPDGWQRCFDGGLFGLARLGSGRASLIDRRLDIMARIDDEARATAAPAEIRTAVAGACEVNARVDVIVQPEPDNRWRAVYDGTTVVMDGEVPSQTARQALLQQARRQFGTSVRVVDEMKVVENRSRIWPRAAETGLAALTDLQRGEAVLERQTLMVTGEARWDPPLLQRVRQQIDGGMPQGYVGREKISMVQPQPPQPTPQQPPAPPVQVQPSPPPTAPTPSTRPLAPEAQACQERLREAARSGVITFERARADLTADSVQTLNRLAQVARACPRVRIEIEGHTDAEGTPERNQRLSDRRAKSVQAFLARAGVDQTILSAVGYGETRPIAPNDTAENRARNRRIEFTVLE